MSTPVLVLFHLLATTVPPVVTTAPTVKPDGAVVSTVNVELTSTAGFPAASLTFATIVSVVPLSIPCNCSAVIATAPVLLEVIELLA